MLPLLFIESFVWAFIPFRLTIAISPAIAELRTATCMSQEELLWSGKAAAAESATSQTAESSLRRVLSHVRAAGTTAGRTSEMFGILIPVRTSLSIYRIFVRVSDTFAALARPGLSLVSDTVQHFQRSPNQQRAFESPRTLSSICLIKYQGEIGYDIVYASYFWIAMETVHLSAILLPICLYNASIHRLQARTLLPATIFQPNTFLLIAARSPHWSLTAHASTTCLRRSTRFLAGHGHGASSSSSTSIRRYSWHRLAALVDACKVSAHLSQLVICF